MAPLESATEEEFKFLFGNITSNEDGDNAPCAPAALRLAAAAVEIGLEDRAPSMMLSSLCRFFSSRFGNGLLMDNTEWQNSSFSARTYICEDEHLNFLGPIFSYVKF
jgi:hypothetical protein